MLIDAFAPFDVCPGCGMVDPEMDVVDFGIGHYEYWGAVGYHIDEHVVTKCCECQAEPFWPEPADEDAPPDHPE